MIHIATLGKHHQFIETRSSFLNTMILDSWYRATTKIEVQVLSEMTLTFTIHTYCTLFISYTKQSAYLSLSLLSIPILTLI